MRVLPVQVHEPRPHLAQSRGGRHPAVHPRPGAAGRGDGAGEDGLSPALVVGRIDTVDLYLTVGEPALHQRFLRAGTHENGVRAAADEKFESLDDERLAGARLSRQGCHTVFDIKSRVFDDSEVPHPQLEKHPRPA